jgi:hypothetical protein
VQAFSAGADCIGIVELLNRLRYFRLVIPIVYKIKGSIRAFIPSNLMFIAVLKNLALKAGV